MEWISVNDRLPEKSGEFLCSTKEASIYVGFYKKHHNIFYVYGAGSDPIGDIKFTHWMPLPEPPKTK